MDSFSYCLEDRGILLPDDMQLPVNSLGGNNFVKDFAFKGVYDSDKTMLIFDEERAEGTASMESVFPDMIGEFLGNPFSGTDNLVIKLPSTYYQKKLPSKSVFGLDQFAENLGFGSELSDVVYNHSDKKESLIESENLTNSKKGCSRVSSEGSIVSSLVEDSLPAKRAWTTNFNSRTPHCQVQGCHKDLSSSKDYHKRHRVCADHSKSAKVIINGIEKRFCQQCSRFHLLKEFDDVKRSCRRRLAGHNERRRKPQFGPQLGVDSSLLEMDLLKSGPFLLIEEHPAGFYYQEKYADDNPSKRTRLEKGAGVGNFEFPMPLEYGCAPSLLSFKSKDLSSYSQGNSEARNPAVGGSYPAYKTSDQKSFKHSEPTTLNSFLQVEHFPMCTRNQESPMVYDGSTVVCSDVQRYEVPPSSGFILKYCHSSEVEPMLDLLDLSSHLRRVEQQQNSVRVKQGNFAFCCSLSA